jgi:DNA-binding MurR/RpiR family transcriptional regulator
MLKIEKTIKKDWKHYTPSEQKLANYFLSHLHELPFETAASIGKRVSVSPMTVGRYIKKLGYSDLRDIKDEMRASSNDNTWNPSDASRQVYAQAPLKAKIEALVDVYKLPQSPDWPRIVSLLAKASVVHVASFHIGRFLGLGFASFLQRLRPNVYFSDGGDGSYADVLLDPEPNGVLVLIDFRRYSDHFRMLAEEAAARKIRTVILTDVYCHWARAVSEDVLMIETEFGIQSLSMAQILFELLLGDVAKELGGPEARVEAVHQLRAKFVGLAQPGANSRQKKTRK